MEVKLPDFRVQISKIPDFGVQVSKIPDFRGRVDWGPSWFQILIIGFAPSSKSMQPSLNIFKFVFWTGHSYDSSGCEFFFPFRLYTSTAHSLFVVLSLNGGEVAGYDK
jgi:hypothetical protein